MFTIRYMKCGRKWRVVAHEGGRKLGVLLYMYSNFWLQANIAPVRKEIVCSLASNYRPISLT